MIVSWTPAARRVGRGLLLRGKNLPNNLLYLSHWIFFSFSSTSSRLCFSSFFHSFSLFFLCHFCFCSPMFCLYCFIFYSLLRPPPHLFLFCPFLPLFLLCSLHSLFTLPFSPSRHLFLFCPLLRLFLLCPPSLSSSFLFLLCSLHPLFLPPPLFSFSIHIFLFCPLFSFVTISLSPLTPLFLLPSPHLFLFAPFQLFSSLSLLLPFFPLSLISLFPTHSLFISLSAAVLSSSLIQLLIPPSSLLLLPLSLSLPSISPLANYFFSFCLKRIRFFLKHKWVMKTVRSIREKKDYFASNRELFNTHFIYPYL
ncbi:unnamed protein product [Acanthosepion pharaonis]|uniref:Uncharacterized protein n=1 Tax=Acanthosepion pharaonis TaxID=158019 RepID=A0A812B784_ACAPH|nr:unnamed protein product [Sepia pharaonis]